MTAKRPVLLLNLQHTIARANPTSQPLQLHTDAPQKTLAATQATSDKADTVEARITSLHAELKITPAEDAMWNGVAQAMRENITNLEKLVAEKATQAPQNMTALDDDDVGNRPALWTV